MQKLKEFEMFVMMWNGEVESDEMVEVQEFLSEEGIGVEDVKVMKEESVMSEELMWKSGKVVEVYEVDGKFEKLMWLELSGMVNEEH